MLPVWFQFINTFQMVVLLHYVNPQLVINVDFLRNIYRHIAHPIYKMSQLKNEILCKVQIVQH